ncbi:hypothetical protein G7046_g1943 [Stylonectria norvegica]|nr:hypothetical protein G7046_g1943 [Stylonectria norvegica]
MEANRQIQVPPGTLPRSPARVNSRMLFAFHQLPISTRAQKLPRHQQGARLITPTSALLKRQLFLLDRPASTGQRPCLVVLGHGRNSRKSTTLLGSRVCPDDSLSNKRGCLKVVSKGLDKACLSRPVSTNMDCLPHYATAIVSKVPTMVRVLRIGLRNLLCTGQISSRFGDATDSQALNCSEGNTTKQDMAMDPSPGVYITQTWHSALAFQSLLCAQI